MAGWKHSRSQSSSWKFQGTLGALTKWATALRTVTEVNSQTAPRPLLLWAPAIAEQQPEAGHALAMELPPYWLGKIQRPSQHTSAQHKPLGVTVVPVKKGQDQVESLGAPS